MYGIVMVSERGENALPLDAREDLNTQPAASSSSSTGWIRLHIKVKGVMKDGGASTTG